MFNDLDESCFPSSFRPCTLRIIAATRPGSQSLEFTASVKPGKIWEYLSSSKVKKVAFSQILSARFFVFSRMTRILRSNLICEDWAPQLCRADIGSRAEYFVTTTTALPKSRKNVEFLFAGTFLLSKDMAPQRGILERWWLQFLLLIPTWGRFPFQNFSASSRPRIYGPNGVPYGVCLS